MKTAIIPSVIFTCFGILTAGISCAGADLGLCASAEQKLQVESYYQENPGTLPMMAMRSLNLSESQVLDSLPPTLVAAADGSAFEVVWNLLTGWNNVMFLLVIDGHVIEVTSDFPGGTPSTRSSYFNLEGDAALHGHLRPDRVGAIYALDLSSEGSTTARAIIFTNTKGVASFSLYVSGPEREATDAEIARFESLKQQIEEMPGPCDDLAEIKNE